MTSEKITKKRGRPRSNNSTKAVLKTASKLLKTTPVRALSIEAIAKSAKVGKATIYRNWPNGKTAIVLDVLINAPELSAPLPEVKTHAQATLEQLKKLLSLLSSDNGVILAQLLAEGAGDKKSAAALEEKLMSPLRGALAASIQAAQQNGEFSQDIEPKLAVDSICGAPFFRVLSTGKPIDEAFCKSWVDCATQLLSQGTPISAGRLL